MAYEWAIRVEKTGDLNRFPAALDLCEPGGTSSWDRLRQEVGNLLVTHFGPAPLTRLYFASEFCPLLIPGVADLKQAWSAAHRRAMRFTLLTPFVTDSGMAKLRPLFAFLSEQDAVAEVVVNDWGVLQVLRHNYRRLRPVVGRLLCKQLKDPRLARPEALNQFSARGKSFISGSSVSEGRYVRLLRDWGINLVSLDYLVQGLHVDLNGTGLAGSLHLPFSHVAGGRQCLLASLPLSREHKFRPVEACRRECRDYVLELRHESSPLRLFQRGNTVVSLPSEQMLADARQKAATLGIRRLVYEWA